MTNYADMRPGEFWAVIHKALAAGAVFEESTIVELLDFYRLTPAELRDAARTAEATTSAILAIRAGKPEPDGRKETK